MLTSGASRKWTYTSSLCLTQTLNSIYFPPTSKDGQNAVDSLDYDTEEEQADEPEPEASTEILSQLPDVPTTELVNIDQALQPSPKKQKTEDTTGDDFVVVENDGAGMAKPKAEL